jgi:hypothetical protein
MKIDETKPQGLNEGPLDLLTKSGRAQRSAFKSGQATLKATGDKLMQEFATYLGKLGKKSYNQASTEDVINFLNSKNAETGDINPDTPMDKNRIKQIFVNKAKARIRGGDAKGQQPIFKSQRGMAADPEFKTSQKPKFKSQRGKPADPEFKTSQKPKFKSQRGKDATPVAPQFKSSRSKQPAGKMKMPAPVMKGIQGMSDQDKLRLGQALVKKYGGNPA